MSETFVALLRGINVGGNNIIKMADLKAHFEAQGFTDVRTYIQSGNVVFTSPKKEKHDKLVGRIEKALGETFSYVSRVVIVSATDLATIIEEAPKGFGKEPDKYRYDVIFLRPPLTPADALAEIPTNPAVDAAHAGQHAVYYRRLIAKATASRLGKVTQKPVYQQVTIRNWNTTSKLLALMAK